MPPRHTDTPGNRARPTTGVPRPAGRQIEATESLAGPPNGDIDAQRAAKVAALHAMAQPQPADTPEMSALRQALRDQYLMAHIASMVDQWPALTADQRETLSALFNPRPAKH
ncbi:hypothetical protein Val02_62450 [Virgisporangium aliadipatigenens]|uniref:Uncharacterized protein n=1 Tax=Virgisporangium aliadipatigenens TaxID=741659 RepID=A0A8J4DT28_9ACTN|nr:hypothetical protein [Virgisporangium aliadipatigenens]GIJ49359.1 hypothetical protein Val02_62450 [Virgisporangium aliadipatigenens]